VKVVPSDTVSRVAGCEMSYHGLSVTNCAAMLQQDKQQYSTRWICDKCNKNHSSASTDPIHRCLMCGLDYCSNCSSLQSVSTQALASVAPKQITPSMGYPQHCMVVRSEKCEEKNQNEILLQTENTAFYEKLLGLREPL
jgi:hypothetical protein